MKIIISIAALALLMACSGEQPSSETSLSVASDINEPVNQTPVENIIPDDYFDTDTSVLTLMNAIIQPSALELWQAVRYVVTADGVEEDIRPQTDEDWFRLQASAISLIEVGNSLLIPGRVMDNESIDPDYPDYQYRPEEIQALVESDAENWRAYIKEMQFFTKNTLEAIEEKDLIGLMETGAAINNACQGCHAEFWYRPNN